MSLHFRTATTAAAFSTLLLLAVPQPFSGRQAAAADPAPTRLVLAGSGSSLPVTRKLAEAFMRSHPGIKIEVPASIGSTGAFRAAADGAVAIGLVSRAPRDEEKKLGLTIVPYARTAAVVGAHPSVGDEGIAFADLVNIYKGVKARWQDGQTIVVLTREPGDSSIEVLEKGVPGFGDAYRESQRAKRWITVLTDQEMNRTLEKTAGAVGLSDMGAITAEHLKIKPLMMNGIAPTPANVRNGKYPLVKTLAFVYRKDKLSAGARAFLDFVRSKRGEKVLAENGYLDGE